MKKIVLLLIFFFYLPLSNAADFDSEPYLNTFISIPFGADSKNRLPTYGFSLSLMETDNFSDHDTKSSLNISRSSDLLKFQITGNELSSAKLNELSIASMLEQQFSNTSDPRGTTTEEKLQVLAIAALVITSTTVVVITSDD